MLYRGERPGLHLWHDAWPGGSCWKPFQGRGLCEDPGVNSTHPSSRPLQESDLAGHLAQEKRYATRFCLTDHRTDRLARSGDYRRDTRRSTGLRQPVDDRAPPLSVQPQSPYPGTPDGTLPEPYKHCLDPLETLTFAAAHTTRVGLGTSVLDMLYYNPVMLARRLSTLDRLSHGRLRVGLGLGWSKDEFDATGASWSERGARGDEFLAVLKVIWTSDPVEFQGQFYHIPKSIIQPKPVQKPYPPLYLAAFAPPALRRLAH